MAQVTLNIPDNKYSAFLEVVKKLGYAQLESEYTVPEWQKKEVNRRMEEYYKNPEIAEDFETVIKELKEGL